MIGTEFIPGFGLGNQLLLFITARSIADQKGCEFGCVNPAQVGNVFHSQKGMYFMDIDLGKEILPEEKTQYTLFYEQDDRLYMGNSEHDINNGCYISGVDPKLFDIEDQTIIYGNCQAEAYFNRDKLKNWLKVKPEYESHEYTADDLCIINMRGGEYTDCPELYLDRKYWLHAIRNMKKVNPKMRFMIITEDEEAARKVLPEYECHHFDMGKDFVTIKNARYLILSNSSFAITPVLLSEELKYAIAPKYWARHNISDGFWSSEQNIYSFLHYQDRSGHLFTAEECRQELALYKETSSLYHHRNIRPGKVRLLFQKIRSRMIYAAFYIRKIIRSLERRTGVIRSYRTDCIE